MKTLFFRLHVVRANDLQELGLALPEAAPGLRRVMPVEMGWRVHEHDPVRLRRGREGLAEERERFGAGSGGVERRRVTDPPGLS